VFVVAHIDYPGFHTKTLPHLIELVAFFLRVIENIFELLFQHSSTLQDTNHNHNEPELKHQMRDDHSWSKFLF